MTKIDQKLVQQNQRILQHLNTERHSSAEIRQLVGEMLNERIDDSVEIRLPFYLEYGRNIVLGKDIFINCNVMLSDQSPIILKDGVSIGPGTMFLTADCLDGENDPKQTITVGNNTRIGAQVTVFPGVTIGKNVVVASGSNVKFSVPDGAVYREGAIQ